MVMGTLTERAALYRSGGMVKGWAKVGSLAGVGGVVGRKWGGKWRRESGKAVILTEGAEEVIVRARMRARDTSIGEDGRVRESSNHARRGRGSGHEVCLISVCGEC